VAPIFLDPHPKGMKELTDLMPAIDHVPACLGTISAPNDAGSDQFTASRASARETVSHARCARHFLPIEFNESSAVAQCATKNPEQIRSRDGSMFEDKSRCRSDHARSRVNHALK